MGHKRRKGKGKTQQQDPKVPRTILISRGKTNTLIWKLKRDLRLVLAPNTGMKLKERKYNKTRDFLDVCGPLGVSHVLGLFMNDSNMNLKIVKIPQGPTVSLRLASYSLTCDVQRSLRCPFDVTTGSFVSPLVVLTNFKKTKEHKVLTTMLQNMFPSIDTGKEDITSKRRVVLFDYDSAKDMIYFRHYLVSLPVSGLSKGMKTLMYGTKVPDLGNVKEVGDFLTKSGYASESEGEEVAESRIELPEENFATKRRVKLTEIGPRMNLTLYKVEQGKMEGLVLYNKYVQKTMEEIQTNQKRREDTAHLRLMRTKQQEMNIEKKRKEREQKLNTISKGNKSVRDDAHEEDDDDNDVEYYRNEVGLDPDSHFGIERKKRKTKTKNL